MNALSSSAEKSGRNQSLPEHRLAGTLSSRKASIPAMDAFLDETAHRRLYYRALANFFGVAADSVVSQARGNLEPFGEFRGDVRG
jgi:hypothetical protein